ncbi:MAG TPA: hypothetical protein VN247_08645, partial [Arenimonas sp.]|nr:hypothetical protein [Arenimonas sp.]
NVGVGTNRFLAKLAAGLHKPDGLDIITANNLHDVYNSVTLLDLPGINTRYQARLNAAGIFTPTEFLNADMHLLRKQVFKSIVGVYWNYRLRGFEVDNIDFGRKSYGQQYALGEKTKDIVQLSRLLMKLCEKAGRRMRNGGYIGGGIHIWLNFENRQFWAQGKKLKKEVYSTQDIFLAAQRLLNSAIIPARVTNIGITVFNLKPHSPEQLGLFDNTHYDNKSIAEASDIVNNRYGEFTLVPALMANMQDVILKRVAFGSVREL